MEIVNRCSISKGNKGMRAKKGKNNIIKIAIYAVLIASAVFASPQASAAEMKLIPIGSTVGINLTSEGVMVVGIPGSMKDGTTVSPAKTAGIRVGDIITHIGGDKIESKDDLKAAAKNFNGDPVSMKVQRNGQTIEFTVTPHNTGNGTYELGLWMRDGIAGIGTLTFYDPQTGIFGALGHSINDSEAGITLPLRDGVIARSSVTDIAAGKAGAPGQLHGEFDFDDVLGSVTVNTGCGIFGFLGKTDMTEGRQPLPIASASELHTGPATILANVSGREVKEYNIEISRVYSGAEAEDRSMMITVTDPKLIEKTGGIVQGMSGSPIIQDGKLVGAVTHVLINDPERGYGVSVEKMFKTALESAEKKAA